MSDHTTTLVPLDTWHYMSPGLYYKGKSVDMGLFAEALIYYDRVLLIPSNPFCFADFISWFEEQNRLGDLIALLEDGTIEFYYYSFLTSLLKKEGGVEIKTFQVQKADQSSVFLEQCVCPPNLSHNWPNTKQKSELYQAIAGHFSEVKAQDFEHAIRNALTDYNEPERCALLLQALFDEIHTFVGLRKSPEVKAKVIKHEDQLRVSWNIDFDSVNQIMGEDLRLEPALPLLAATRCNQFLWSAAQLKCDLFLQAPISSIAGDKLYESSQNLIKTKDVIEQLEAKVEFPDIRNFVNSDQIDLKEVLEWRKKGRRFRKWLQDESDRDRDAILAYHFEAAKESGWTRGQRKTLAILGVLAGAGASAAVGDMVAGVPGAILAAAAEGGLVYLFDLASKFQGDWKPVVFGNWAQDRIRKKLQQK